MLRQLDSELRRIEMQPHKVSIQTSATTYMNVLSGQLQDGTSGSKTIWYDEETGESGGIVVVKAPDGRTETFDANEITALRCGLMAVYAMEKLFSDRLDGHFRVGFVGFGKIGKAVYKALFDRFTVLPVVYHRGTRWPFSALGDCDVLVTATTARPGDLRISAHDFAGPVISFDGGLILGPTFRRRDIAADHPSQLMGHWGVEFPCERLPEMVAILPFAGLLTSPCVHLYGVGVADLIVAREIMDARSGAARPHRRVPAYDAGPSDERYGWGAI